MNAEEVWESWNDLEATKVLLRGSQEELLRLSVTLLCYIKKQVHIHTE